MEKDESLTTLDSYKLNVFDTIVDITVSRSFSGFSFYNITIQNITPTTNVILQKIRDEFVTKVNLADVQITDESGFDAMRGQFKKEILVLIRKYFPNANRKTMDLLMNQIIRQNIGLGDIEILLKDANLEEIAINTSKEPLWVYHKKYGWLKTNILIPEENRIRHYATMIGRDVGKEITLLKPLLDAHLLTGDRVNATLYPISTKGNTITIRKFAEKPWTITDFIKSKTIDYETSAMIWLAVQNELSLLISGGTGSGKTSMLNVCSAFIPINQRIISIEDTREITLPSDLHWVPLETRLPNPEGKGEITMLDLVVNSLRMRPDRIIMGEIRRKREAEVLFEAMHTGHSVYGTLHANNVEETIQRLTNPPIDVPKMVLPALHMIVVQNRNRRTGFRRTLQLAEITKNGDASIIKQLDMAKDQLVDVNEPQAIMDTIKLYTGMTKEQIVEDLREKMSILKWIVEKNINNVDRVGDIFRKYYARRSVQGDSK
ncbi:MAG: archaeal flagellar protein FlaI [archaeon GW2011_AR3]|nr:MAG: archaeal flagellar protein FlaI [archaeon GW2011_AR3]MBS3110071.1 CpaF family protein [Candidatus Woesearchaeota archaeon]